MEQALAKVLTPAQLDEYKEYLEERRGKAPGGDFGGPGGPGGGPPPGGGGPGRRSGGGM